MRNAINSLGSGNMDVCFVLLEVLQVGRISVNDIRNGPDTISVL